MKRGLKAQFSWAGDYTDDVYNLFPDEKGTESWLKFSHSIHLNVLFTTYSPMKRGLKAAPLDQT